ncbi:hypothetical protein NBRC110019_20490 [Neptunitalea chrysea]|uniref:Transglutaminase-like domain-containing protein n=1 Tax=Neptunitalea chrysea TaxID=1647581 RepID=A0A9W6B814_9FLAO|nr:transglutaminase-like domain-containing protein [Neptunitalea chrysea]GLB53009.1 hypothetical protein NBRC110019_20490 [Neptunitalea chrysea]
MNKRLIAISLFSLAFLSLHAQKKLKISDEQIAHASELKKQFTDDDLALDYFENNISFHFNSGKQLVVVTEATSQSIYNIGNRADIPIYEFYNSESEITKFEATRSEKKKKILLKTKDEIFNSNGIFHQDVLVKHCDIDFPLFGSKYDIYITKKYKDIKYFTTISFMEKYPIETHKIYINVPSWLDIEFKEMNFEGFDIQKTVTPTNIGTLYTYTAKNLPAQYKEKKMLGYSYIYPHLLVLAKSQSKNNKKVRLFESTADQYAWYKSLTDELKNNHSVFAAKVAELTKDATTDEEKIKNIFYWVQDNIRYIAFEDGIAGFKPDEASNVFTNRYGDCKGMANLTKNMLTEAGFDARLCWIGTNHIAYDYSTPNLAVDNHMICAVKYHDSFVFLDGTEDYNVFGEYANRIQNRQVLIEDGDNYILERIPDVKSEHNKNASVIQLTLDGEQLTGKAHKQLQGESRTSLLQYFHTIENNNKEDFLKYFLSFYDNGNVSIANPVTSDLTDREANIVIDYDITLDSFVTSYDKDLYITMEYENIYSSYDFEKRKTDYSLYYKKNIEDVVELTIPAGYKVTYLPKAIEINNPDFAISLGYEQKGDKVVYTKKFAFHKDKIAKENFAAWNEFHKQLTNMYQETITLTKI